MFPFNKSYFIRETVTSYYLQLDAKFLDNRLSITTGFRFEGTQDMGLSSKMPPMKIPNPDPNHAGELLTDAQLTFAPPYQNMNGNLQDLYELLQADFIAQNWIARGQKSTKSYADIYPSFFANYNLTANAIARFSYAKTLGRPDFSNIIPIAHYNVTNDTEGDYYTRIQTSNPALKPYTAHNFDLSFEYYFKNGGMASAGLFYKKVNNAFGNQTVAGTPEMLSDMGINNMFVNPQLIMPVNAGTITAKGVELNLRAPLSFIPRIGRFVSVMANTTLIDLKAPYNAQLDAFVKKSANWGVSVDTRRLSFQLLWNWTGQQRITDLTGTQYQPQDQVTNTPLPQDFQGFYLYIEPRLTLDANMNYRINKYLNFFINARNITNSMKTWSAYNSKTPDYAKTYLTEIYGTQVSFGIKGSF